MSQGFSTRAIHAGYDPDPLTGAVNVPIYASSTFAQTVWEDARRVRVRTHRQPDPACPRSQPRRSRRRCSAGPSPRGWPPPTPYCCATLRPGDHSVILNDAYGGTFRIEKKKKKKKKKKNQVAPDRRRRARRHHRQDRWCGSKPHQPLLNVGDIAVLAEITHGAGAKLVVDNTTAVLPAVGVGRRGAAFDHRVPGGHSDVVGGALITDDEQPWTPTSPSCRTAPVGARPVRRLPQLRGIATLAVRMDRHSDNAERRRIPGRHREDREGTLPGSG